MEMKFKSCPAGHIDTYLAIERHRYRCFCNTCYWSGPLEQTEQVAVTSWNIRASDDKHRIAKLEYALSEAIRSISEWSALAPEFFRDKWRLKEQIELYRNALEGDQAKKES